MIDSFDGEIQYLLFTDEDKNTNFEKIKISNELHPRYLSRKIKCLPHQYLPQHQYSIWFDASMMPKGKISSLIDQLKENIGVYKHRDPMTVQSIAERCASHKWDNSDIIREQITKYHKEKMPKNIPTFETGILVRKNNEQTNRFNELWWNEIKNHSIRDQISFPYCIWKTQINYQFLTPGIVVENPYFTFHSHNPSEPYRNE